MHWLGTALCLVAAGYSLLALATVFKRPARENGDRPVVDWPRVTVLKPLCGDEPQLYECLHSFCRQDYPHFQIVFGLQDPEDPAGEIVARLRHAFPDLDLALVTDSQSHGSNLKVSNLANMMRAAKYDYLVLSDSDIQVTSDYLRQVVPPLLDPQVGTVTCAYRARPRSNLWSRLNGLFIDDWFAPTVRIGRLFGNKTFSSGATLGIRRETLEAIGGFAAIADHLADDYMLSALPRRLGLRTVLSPHVVETIASETTLASLLAHEARWMRTLRSLEPVGYNFTLITMSAALLIPGILLAWGHPVALSAGAVTLLARAALRVIRNRHAGCSPWRGLALLPLRGILNVYVWCCGFSRSPVNWRGHRYGVAKRGALHKLTRKE